MKLYSAFGFETDEKAAWLDELKRRRIDGPRLNSPVPDKANQSRDTVCVHAGTYTDPTTGAVGTPIFQTTTFRFGEQSYDAFMEGFTRDVPIYSRYGNPSQWAVQQKIAALEGAESTLLCASGMAAIATTLLALTSHDGHIISSNDVYGGSYNLLREDMHQWGRDVSFVDGTDIDAIEAAIKPTTQLFFFETLTNPLLKAIPLREIVALAHRRKILVVLDNTFLSPIFLRPLELGADIVIHSATKYLNGHSDVTAGVASGSRKYVDRIWAQMLKLGGSCDPLSSFLLERGLKTLHLRMRTHHANAMALAAALSCMPGVKTVHHPSIEGYRYPWVHDLCPDGQGGVVSFEVEGGDAGALNLLDKLRLPAVATSLGGVESLVSLPFNTSHNSLTQDQQRKIGIQPGLVRYSVGIEDAHDIITDIRNAMEAIQA